MLGDPNSEEGRRDMTADLVNAARLFMVDLAYQRQRCRDRAAELLRAARAQDPQLARELWQALRVTL